jgi:hypothetical protein
MESKTNKMIKDIVEGIRVTNGCNALYYASIKGNVERIKSKLRL